MSEGGAVVVEPTEPVQFDVVRWSGANRPTCEVEG